MDGRGQCACCSSQRLTRLCATFGESTCARGTLVEASFWLAWSSDRRLPAPTSPFQAPPADLPTTHVTKCAGIEACGRALRLNRR